jgi:hypothetical protein
MAAIRSERMAEVAKRESNGCIMGESSVG